MSATHTRGPWRVIPPRIGASITVYTADGQTPIATTCSNTSPKTMEMHRSGEVKANAALIAAAPELLDALIAIADQLERVGDTRQHKDGQFIDDAREAIAKATGGAA